MENIIIIAIVLLAVGSAASYIIKKKKNGAKCIGCPNSDSCGKCCCEGKGK